MRNILSVFFIVLFIFVVLTPTGHAAESDKARYTAQVLPVKPISYADYAKSRDYVEDYIITGMSRDAGYFLTTALRDGKPELSLWKIEGKKAILDSKVWFPESKYKYEGYADYMHNAISGDAELSAFPFPVQDAMLIAINDWKGNLKHLIKIPIPGLRESDEFGARYCSDIVFSPDRSKIAVCYTKQHKRKNSSKPETSGIFSLETGKLISHFGPKNDSFVEYDRYNAWFSPSGRYLLVAAMRNDATGRYRRANSLQTFGAYDIESGNLVCEVDLYAHFFTTESQRDRHLEKNDRVGQIEFFRGISVSPDEKFIAFCCEKGLMIKEIESNKIIDSVAGYGTNYLNFGENNQFLNVAEGDGFFRCYRYWLNGGKLVRLAYEDISGDYIRIAYSSKDRKWILIGDTIHTLKLFADNQFDAKGLHDEAVEIIEAEFYKPGVKKMKEAISKDPLLATLDSFTNTIERLVTKGVPLQHVADILLYRYHKLLEGEMTYLKVDWARKTFYQYGFFATLAGHQGITKQAASEFRKVFIKTDSLFKQKTTERYALCLEALAMAAQGQADKAYNYLIENGGIIVDDYTVPAWYIKHFKDAWKPLYKNRKNLPFY